MTGKKLKKPFVSAHKKQLNRCDKLSFQEGRSKLYLGRIVGIGKTNVGESYMFYRLASREFPNRLIVQTGPSLSVRSKPGYETQSGENANLIYPCFFQIPGFAIVGNGDHTQLIRSYLDQGEEPIEAIATAFGELGYERDEKRTPRLVGVLTHERSWLGIINEKAVIIEELDLKDGFVSFVSTEERSGPETHESKQKDENSVLNLAKGRIESHTLGCVVVFSRDREFSVEYKNF